MCDLNKVSGFIVAAQVAFLVVIGLLIAGTINAATLFAAAANIALMVAVIIAAGLGVAFLAAAIAELGRCDFGVCNPALASLKTMLALLVTAFSIILALLIGITVVAAIPFAGSVFLGGVLAALIMVMIDLAALVQFLMIDTIDRLNACQQAQNAANMPRTAIFVLMIVTVVVVVVASVAGVWGGAIPVKFEFP